MRQLLVKSLALAVATVVLAGSARADIITQWNFNSVPPDGNTATGTTDPNLGVGTITTVGGVTSAFASGAASGGSSDPATEDNSGLQTTNYPLQNQGDLTAGIEVFASTAGYFNVLVSWDQRHSNTSSRFAQFQYTVDGTNWISYLNPFEGPMGDTWFNNRQVDLSGIAEVNDNANFGFRVLATFAPGTTGYVASRDTSTYAATGTWRFDMVTVQGQAVPEPASLLSLIVGGGLIGVVAYRRRRSA